MPRIIPFESVAIAMTLGLILALPASAQSTSRISALELPDRFETLDTDKNDQISFAEFSAYAETQQIPRGEAAQVFMALSAGDPILTPVEYLYGVRIADSHSWIDGYDLDGEYYGEILAITPNEEVAGEVIHAFEAPSKINPDGLNRS